MRILQYVVLLLLLCTAAHAQVVLNGKVADASGNALDGATVFLTRVKDSAMVEYTVTDNKGAWEIKTPKFKDSIALKVSYTGFTTYKQLLKTDTQSRDFGLLKLEELPTELDEILIESEIPPIRVKKDTLEFNAGSFKVRPNATLDALLKKLPGISIDADGLINFNGKKVNQILVDGKPFFGTDGAVALENLPAEIIDKIQVTDLKTKQEEMTGQKAKGQDASINVTLKKDRNSGFFGTVTGGYGTDDRYEASTFINYFKDKRRVSITASSNNINASGFNMGGRGMGSVRMVGGAIGSFGGGNGQTVSSSAGVNYTDEPVKDLETTLGYNYSNTDSENRNRTETINYTPAETDPETGELVDRTYRSRSLSSSKGVNFGHNVDAQIRLKVDSTTNIIYMPRFSMSERKSNSVNESTSNRLSDGALLNENNAQNYTEGNSNQFTGALNYYKRFTAKKGRGLSLMFSHNNNTNTSQNNNRSNTVAYTYANGTTQTSTDNRNQVLNNNNRSSVYMLNAQYFEPLTDSLKLTVSTEIRNDKDTDSRNSYDFDDATGGYTVYNDSLSNYLSSKTFSVSPQVGLVLDKKKYNISMDLGVDFSAFTNHSYYIGNGFDFTKNYLLPAANMRATYKFAQWRSLDFNYGYSAQFPQAMQILPVQDLSNPLNTIVGNPDLNPTTSHNFRMGYRNYGTGQKAGYSFNGAATFYGNQVVQYTTINESAETVTSYRNISGAMNLNIGGNWNKSINRNENHLSINLNMYANYGTNKGFLNGLEYDSKSFSVTPSVYLSYAYGELFEVSPTYSFSYSFYDYQNYSVNSSTSMVHRMGLQTTTYWPKNLMFGNDFSYTYNPQLPANFQRGYFFWNTTLGYSIMDEKFTFRVKVYDVLNQNNGVQRDVGAITTTDSENLVLRRYAMFSVVYKLNAFGGRKSRKN